MTADEFALAEYNSLRAEILAQQGRRDLLLQGTVVAIWLIFVWLATRQPGVQAPAAVISALWLLPAVIAILAAAKHLAMTMGVRRAAAHLATLQAGIPDRGQAGWELRLILAGDEARSIQEKRRRRGEGEIAAEVLRKRGAASLRDELRIPRQIRFSRDVDKAIFAAVILGSLWIGLAGARLTPQTVVPILLVAALALSVASLARGTR